MPRVGVKGGYRVLFDPRPLLAKLESGAESETAWEELWGNLYHQGDVGEASYAAVPHLVRIYQDKGKLDWNTYGIVGAIELARGHEKNPEVPEWLKEEYFEAIRLLAETGLGEFSRASKDEELRAILSVLAIWKGLRTPARFIIDYTEDELLEIEEQKE